MGQGSLELSKEAGAISRYPMVCTWIQRFSQPDHMMHAAVSDLWECDAQVTCASSIAPRCNVSADPPRSVPTMRLRRASFACSTPAYAHVLIPVLKASGRSRPCRPGLSSGSIPLACRSAEVACAGGAAAARVIGLTGARGVPTTDCVEGPVLRMSFSSKAACSRIASKGHVNGAQQLNTTLLQAFLSQLGMGALLPIEPVSRRQSPRQDTISGR